jgi:hypothetical protein
MDEPISHFFLFLQIAGRVPLRLRLYSKSLRLFAGVLLLARFCFMKALAPYRASGTRKSAVARWGLLWELFDGEGGGSSIQEQPAFNLVRFTCCLTNRLTYIRTRAPPTSPRSPRLAPPTPTPAPTNVYTYSFY